MRNGNIADMLSTAADMLALTESDEFRVRSYREAARDIRNLDDSLADLLDEGKDLTELDGIGESIAGKISEIVETGSLSQLDELKRKIPKSLTELLKINGIGPERVKRLHEELGIASLEDLRDALEAKKIQQLEGFGEKTANQMAEGLEIFDESAGRFLLSDAENDFRELRSALNDSPGNLQSDIAGSYRRRATTVGDLDLVILTRDRDQFIEFITSWKGCADTITTGTERTSIRLESGLQVDFRFCDEANYGAALLYFTGSREHTVALRKQAQEKGWKLNAYGLYSDGKRLAGRTESSIYQRFGMDWIPPELRENRGEFKAASKGNIPALIEFDDLKGDLHAHTTETDGRSELVDMVDAAEERGYQYLAITDHTEATSVANGMDEDRLKKHAKRIRQLNSRRENIWLLAGVEVDILKDGGLDMDASVLKKLDYVVASVHLAMELETAAMTDRIIRVIESSVVHTIGHPLGRKIGQRRGYDLEFNRVLDACNEYGVFLEIDGQPDRRDLPEQYVQRARRAGIKHVIGSDAHSTESLDNLRYGLDTARRGWLEKNDVINTRSAKQLQKLLGSSDG